jgi:hypothetical protein
MLPDYYPYIRDTVTIDSQLQEFCQRPSIGPVFLIGRIVQHAARCNLRVTTNPVIIVADVYDGTNGAIDATGPGRGAPGGTVTVMCRQSINAQINASGGWGTGGAPGTDGTPGTPDYHSDGYWETVTDPQTGETTQVWHDGEDIPGTLPTNGTKGGAGGPGGPGGTITFTSIEDQSTPWLSAAGGAGGPGGPGGAAAQGPYSEGSVDGDPGDDGQPGADGQVNFTNLDEEDYVAGLRPLLDSTGSPFANYWAPFRIVTGEYFYHRYNPGVPDRADYARLAGIEFERALELQPDNGDAIRLQRQLAGFPPSAGAAWVGGGSNALGFARDFDLLPDFDSYITAFNSFGALVLDFLLLGIPTILQGHLLGRLTEFVTLQAQQAAAARDNSRDDLAIAKTEQQQAGDDVHYAQQQLDQATSQVQQALTEMQQQAQSPSADIGGFLTTVAEVAGAVLSVVAAIPSGGVSLVALAPDLAALADSVTAAAPQVAQELITKWAADPQAAADAYKAVSADPAAAIPGGSSIINFVTMAQQLAQAGTPANSKYITVVQHGTELAHQLLIARNRAVLAGQRVDAGQARVTRAEAVVAQATALQSQLSLDAATIKQAGLLAIATAQSKAEALLGLAFRAQRSVEIYTLKNEQQHLFLDAGLISPDVARAYYEQDIDEGELANQLIASWANILAPLGLQTDYTSYFDQPHDQDWLRLSFTATDPQLNNLQTRHQFTFWLDPSDVPAGRFDAKIKSLRLALVGAVHPAGEISCEVSHSGLYLQRTRDDKGNAVIATQLLQPRVSTRPAKTTPLLPDEGLGDDPPLSAPQSLAYWGRGIGGDWQLTIPQDQFDSGLNLSGLTQVQVWIGYQFIR